MQNVGLDALMGDALEKIREAKRKGHTRLDLSDNNLSVLPKEIAQLTNLITLDLSWNKLSELPKEITQLTNLTTLYLNFNKLSQLPKEIVQLTNLTSLNLGSNQLTELPKEIAQLTNLTLLDLEDNPLVTPPIEIANKGIGAIRSYFKSLNESLSQKLYEAKLIIVGQGGVGKTCLVNKLLDSNYMLTMQEHTTQGINIKKWKFNHSLKGKKVDFDVNIWDFGGQEIYNSTHQFFLTKRSLYIFVWDGRSEKEAARFEYWLNIVNLLSDGSPVFVVQNKADERTPEIDQAELKDKFKNIAGFHKVSCLNGNGMQELTRQIKDEIQKLPHIGTEWCNDWATIRKSLETNRRDYFSLDEYLKLCSDNRLDQEKAMVLGAYLHDLGVILHFQDDFVLKNTVILKPDRGTDAVYKVLDAEMVKQNHGKLSTRNLSEIWNTKKYPSHKHVELLQLMIKFELCFELEGKKGEYIAPQLLPLIKSEFNWNYNKNLRFEYWYDFMPEGIITRFIARNHFFIENDTYWKNGVILHIDGTRALVICEPMNRKIKVYIEAGERQAYLAAIIKKDIEYIHMTLNEPLVKLMLPCTCEKCAKVEDIKENMYFDINDLNRRISIGKKVIECFKSFEDIPLEQFRWIIGKESRTEEAGNTGTANNVFISYSHKDSRWLDRLKVHLKPYERLGEVISWDDNKIKAGEKWREEIKLALERARVAVLLVSSDFLASDFIAKNELPPLLTAAERGGVKIVWVALGASAVGRTPINDYHCANEPKKTLDSLSRPEQNSVLAKICDKIAGAIV
jgi:internalin A